MTDVTRGCGDALGRPGTGPMGISALAGDVTAAGHTEAEWASIVARMEAEGMQASADDIDAVIAYLAKALPPR